MKILLCGKGGCGKSTLSTLLAREFAKQGKNVLVIDTDESNFGLYRQLGMELPADFTGYFGGRASVMEYKNSGKALFDRRWTIADIPEEYVTRDGNIMLMSMGKIVDAGEGCGCPMGFIARGFVENMDFSEDDVLITDTEAGVEHFGRGLDEFMDIILMVADPSYESIQLSEKIYSMASQLGKTVRFIINKADKNQTAIVKESIEHKEHILVSVPADPVVMLAGLKGERIEKNIPEIEEAVSCLSAL